MQKLFYALYAIGVQNEINLLRFTVKVLSLLCNIYLRARLSDDQIIG